MNDQKWVVDRLPTAEDCDPDGDVLIPHAHDRRIEYGEWANIRLGDPWLPIPPLYVPPKTREELVQELLDAIDSHYWPGNVGPGWQLEVLKAREELR